MRILLVTQYFPPDSPGQIPEAIAKELRDRGHDVKVLTAFPHYNTGRIPAGYKQRLHHVESHHGIPVKRVPIYPSHSSNPFGRIANYMSFVFSARLAGDFVRDRDIIYIHGTPATVAAPARYWAKKLRIPFVFHVQDIWPESVTQSGFLPRPIANVMGLPISWWLKGIYASAAAVNAISPTSKHLLVKRGVAPEKCHVVFNWANDVPAPERSRERRRSGLTLLYAGNLGGLQDLETVIRAVHRLRNLPGLRLLIAGSGAHEQALRKLVANLHADSLIQFIGRVPRTSMASLYEQADFQLVPLKDIDIFAGTIPSKFQDGLAHGLPVITSVKGDVTAIVDRHQLGFSSAPENVDSLAEAITAAYLTTAEERKEYSERARTYYEANFAAEQVFDRIEQILQTAYDAQGQQEEVVHEA